MSVPHASFTVGITLGVIVCGATTADTHSTEPAFVPPVIVIPSSTFTLMVWFRVLYLPHLSVMVYFLVTTIGQLPVFVSSVSTVRSASAVQLSLIERWTLANASSIAETEVYAGYELAISSLHPKTLCVGSCPLSTLITGAVSSTTVNVSVWEAVQLFWSFTVTVTVYSLPQSLSPALLTTVLEASFVVVALALTALPPQVTVLIS